MAQNVYEQENFFKEYIQLPCQVKGLDGTPEWPALKALIPDPKGSTFLDLGCGFGWISQVYINPALGQLFRGESSS